MTVSLFRAGRGGDAPAVIMDTGSRLGYEDLDARSNRLAQWLRSLGLTTGDHIALCMKNRPEFLEVAWAAQRSGLYYTPLSSRLKAEEIAYIVNDCGARVVVTDGEMADAVDAALTDCPGVRERLLVGAGRPGWRAYEDVLAAQPADPLPDATEGGDMLYSSGTTGRPKGVKFPLSGIPVGTLPPFAKFTRALYGIGADTVYLSPAPLYHAAPLRFCMGVHRFGGTTVVMEQFDAEEFLRLIETHRVTHVQVVPTMFVRLLKLPAEVRGRYDVSSLRCVIHAAAPCPVPIKQQMFDWWGPIIHEYYSATESNGFVACTPQEWLAHPGTVGRSLIGELHITDDDGNELPPGESGTIWVANGTPFAYHNDPGKTATVHDRRGWSTLGDVGYLDEDGFLYLTDRKAFMIISGGVNIYPQEAENVLLTHPAVADAAVFGVPDAEFGEEVKAVVQPVDATQAGPELAAELIDYCRARLAHLKCPRSIDFREELPRHPTGKLHKKELRDEYLAALGAR